MARSEYQQATNKEFGELHVNLLKPTGYVMHHQFNHLIAELNPICYLLALSGAHHFLHVSRLRVNIQQLYALPTLHLCVLYLYENKQRLVPLTA
jgi:ABC-type uncharacterized transport system permease subunit